MKKWSLVFVLFLLSFQLFADDDKLKLAVMEFEDTSKSIQPDILAGASEYLRVGFASTNRYVLITKERQKEQIGSLRKKFNTDPTYKACTDKNCQIQLGQALSADMIVKTNISYFAGLYTISSELIDLEKEATIIAAKEDYDGSPKSLRQAIDKIVVRIVEAEKKENELSEEEMSEKAVKKSKTRTNQANSKDQIACEYARKKDSSSTWKTYLSKYPDGECAAEAKETLDNKACAAARKKSTIEGWKKYLGEFPDGKCDFEATEKITALEEKSVTDEIEREDFLSLNSTADEKLAGLFSGRWNFGLGIAFNTPNIVGFSTGLDFNFKVFEKPYGGGAGNLFVGFGVDLRYWVPTTKEGFEHDYDEGYMSDYYRDHLINIPIQFNFGYEFKLNNPALRYIGLWFSPGFSLDMDMNMATYEDPDELRIFLFTVSFSWEITMNMIFKNGILLNIGVGGNKSATEDLRHSDYTCYWELDHTFLMLGTGVIF